MKAYYLLLILFLVPFSLESKRTIERGEGTFDERCTGCVYDEKTDTLTCECCYGDWDYEKVCTKTQYNNASKCESKIKAGSHGGLYCLSDYE